MSHPVSPICQKLILRKNHLFDLAVCLHLKSLTLESFAPPRPVRPRLVSAPPRCVVHVGVRCARVVQEGGLDEDPHPFRIAHVGAIMHPESIRLENEENAMGRMGGVTYGQKWGASERRNTSFFDVLNLILDIWQKWGCDILEETEKKLFYLENAEESLHLVHRRQGLPTPNPTPTPTPPLPTTRPEGQVPRRGAQLPLPREENIPVIYGYIIFRSYMGRMGRDMWARWELSFAPTADARCGCRRA